MKYKLWKKEQNEIKELKDTTAEIKVTMGELYLSEWRW